MENPGCNIPHQLWCLGRLLGRSVVNDGCACFVQSPNEGLVTLKHVLDEGPVLPVNFEHVFDELLRHLEKIATKTK